MTGDDGFRERMEVCEKCVLTRGCTRKTIYAVDGYCWAEKVRTWSGEPVTKEELARRHGLLEDGE